MRVKLMSFDHSASLDNISADRRCFRTTKNWALRVTTSAQNRSVLCALKWNPLVELNTRLIGKELTMVSVKILFLFLKPEIKTLTLPFFSNILISLPGAGFLAFSICCFIFHFSSYSSNEPYVNKT